MYNFCPFMSEGNTTVCHTNFPILHAKSCFGVFNGVLNKVFSSVFVFFERSSCTSTSFSNGKIPGKALFPPLCFFLFPCSGKLSSHVEIKAKVLRDAEMHSQPMSVGPNRAAVNLAAVFPA